MEDSFSLLEERIRQAVAEVQRLRGENASLTRQLADLQKHLDAAEGRTRTSEKKQEEGGARAAEVQSMSRELAGLRREREEIRNRIAKMLEVLEELS